MKHIHMLCVKKWGVLLLNMVVIPAPYVIALSVVGSVGKFYPLGLNVSVSIYRIRVFVKVFNHGTNT